MSTSIEVQPQSHLEIVHPGPRATLRVLRIVAVAHSLVVLAQPMLAGIYLSGQVDALAVHRLNALASVQAACALQLIVAIVYVWRGRGRAWPLLATLGIAAAEELQIAMGFGGEVAIHLPLGVSIISAQILLTVWLFRYAARAVLVPGPDSRTAS